MINENEVQNPHVAVASLGIRYFDLYLKLKYFLRKKIIKIFLVSIKFKILLV
jgi:hypothetical protein